MSPRGIAFILGAGPRIGRGVASNLLDNGYSVALGSRAPDSSAQVSGNGRGVTISVDASNIQSVQDGFAQVKRELGTPNVVIYNVSAYTPADSKDPFASITPEVLERDNAANITGAYTALREAVLGFKSLSLTDSDTGGDGKTLPKVFIATGNVTPFRPIPASLPAGIGKSAIVHMIQIAAKSYSDDGFRFYYASQVSPKGGPVRQVDAGAHGAVFWDLINRQTQGNWDVRFLADGSEVISSG
ncbi:oxidoreductase,short chain dehydrogenase, putative [Coccidioides posadasii C735 delta SOWgp]|uniref:Oxidoreductase,short chain dehydrogenase, putative n=1 Tax=Coccidioides posadasii (strain C735) TaxID=222929 RepID=C5P315_COCP7|nr:oxidoreductase,short chain dehydrogenase, putative [Coccidioides posadasii C735 delta SOWgp]EER28703.1 oxidoreductase,short chain dehydrogenase, putative [Coccidioides posadasii C735 delta SOWgp]|eukprot:XP_003070848.1 oxidoreductase,short chain dehydrogenase, putative [Coccidioides posadasii C735 delta SOWgp]